MSFRALETLLGSREMATWNLPVCIRASDGVISCESHDCECHQGWGEQKNTHQEETCWIMRQCGAGSFPQPLV